MKTRILLTSILWVGLVATLNAQTVLQPLIKPAVSGIKVSSPSLLAHDIAKSSPDPAEATRRMKKQGVAVNDASGALKIVFRLDETVNYKTLSSNGYQKLETANATRTNYNISSADSFNALLVQARENANTRTLFMKEIFGLSFDQTFSLLSRTDLQQGLFNTCVEVFPLSVDELVQTGVRYYNGHFVPSATANDEFYPNPYDMYKLVRSKYPSTGHFVTWAKLLTKGYAVADVARKVPIGEFNQNGRSLDIVAACVRSSSASTTENPRILISFSPDGTVTTSPGPYDCWTKFISQMKAQGISRAMAEDLVLSSLTCQPSGHNACHTESQRVAGELVTTAGYPSSKSR